MSDEVTRQMREQRAGLRMRLIEHDAEGQVP